jgi:predicted site-specific integrase-resolvase
MRRRKLMLWPVAVSIASACAVMDKGVSPATVKEAIRNGELPYYTSKSGRRRILVEDLVKWVRQHWSKTGVYDA